MRNKAEDSNDASLLAPDELRALLPEDLPDGDCRIEPIELDPVACDALRQHLVRYSLDGERCTQTFNSTTDAALQRHAATDPSAKWSELTKSIDRQLAATRGLLKALEETEKCAVAAARRREASLLTRTAGVIEAGRPPRFGHLDGETQMMVRHDPLAYEQARGLSAELKLVALRRERVLNLALAAINTRKGRPRGGPGFPLVERLAGYWTYMTGRKATVSRVPSNSDGEHEVESRTDSAGPFLTYCRLAMACLPEHLRHGESKLESTVRAVCVADQSKKVRFTDDLSRI